jgi:hypothetical protein
MGFKLAFKGLMKSTYALGYLLFSLREIEDIPLAVGLIRLACTNSSRFAMRGLRVAKEPLHDASSLETDFESTKGTRGRS